MRADQSAPVPQKRIVGAVRSADIAGAEEHRGHLALVDEEPHVGTVAHAPETCLRAAEGLHGAGQSAHDGVALVRAGGGELRPHPFDRRRVVE